MSDFFPSQCQFGQIKRNDQVVNLKCDPRLIGSFREEPGIFPGWHMNKARWLTVALEAGVEDEKIKFPADMRYELTKK